LVEGVTVHCGVALKPVVKEWLAVVPDVEENVPLTPEFANEAALLQVNPPESVQMPFHQDPV